MAKIFAPLAHPLFRRFYFGQAVSRAGDTVFYVALPWQILLLGGGADDIGFIFALSLGSQVALALVGGVVVDRVSRRRIVVLSDVAQGAIMVALAAVALSGALGLGHLAVFAVLFGVFQAIAFPAIGAFLPETVPHGELQEANSLFQGTTLGAMMVGSALAGILISAFGPWSAFAFDAATFAVSATLLATMPGHDAPRPTSGKKRSLLSEAKEGWSYVSKVPWLWMAIVVFAVFNAVEASPRTIVVPVLVGVDLHGGVVAIGFVAAAFQAGWLSGSFLPSFLPPFRRPGLVAYAMAGATGAVLVLVSLSTAVWQIALLFFAQGVTFGVFGVIWSTSLARFVDKRVRGRVISIDALGSISLMPLSSLLVGAAAAAYGAAVIFVFGGLVIVLLAIFGLLYRPANDFGPAPALEKSQDPPPRVPATPGP